MKELAIWEQHKTPKEVAMFMRSQGASVGMKYSTHQEVWNDKESLKIGLLHMILDAVTQKKDQIKEHKTYLVIWQKEVLKLAKEHEKHRRRLIQLMKTDKLGDDIRNNLKPADGPFLYKNDWIGWHVEKLKGKIKRMKQVKKPEQIDKLLGIGAKRKKELLEQVK